MVPWRIEPETYLMLISQYFRAEFGCRLSQMIILLKLTLLLDPFTPFWIPFQIFAQ